MAAKKSDKKPAWLLNNEDEVYSGFANKIGFFGGPGGQLVLTNNRIIFTNRRKNKLISEYNLSDIVYVDKARSATVWTVALLVTVFLKNSIKITLKSGKRQRFVVSNRDTWIGLINERKPAPSK